MNQLYSLKFPRQVHCGMNAITQLPLMIQKLSAKRICVLTDDGVEKSGTLAIALQYLNEYQVQVVGGVPPEPEDKQVIAIYNKVKHGNADLIVAIGGGSVMDTAKMVAVLITNADYQKDLTNQELIVLKGLPMVMIPTSAGTGSEATPNSIVVLPERGIKLGVVHDFFMPQWVILDPQMTRSLPKSVTAATGVDAFCHCIETLISKKCTPASQVFSLEGMKLINQYLQRAYDDGSDMEAREMMLLAAFYGGIAITASSTTGVHALSYPLGGTYRIPHGVSNAILLPHVMEFNIDAIDNCLVSIAEAMEICTDVSTEELKQTILDKIFAMIRNVNIPTNLSQYAVNETHLEALVDDAYCVKRLLDQNPKVMTKNDILQIYKKVI